MSFHAPIAYTTPAAIVKAWQDRGYTSLAIKAHMAAKERARRMTPIPFRKSREMRLAEIRSKYAYRMAEPYRTYTQFRLFFMAVFIYEALTTVSSEFSDKQADKMIAIRFPPVRLIIQRTAKEFNVTPVDILSHRRTARIVLPRQIAMWVSKNVRPDSLPKLGDKFGGKDHTTILHAVRKIDALVANGSDVGLRAKALKEHFETYR